jgi:ABC-2 type transport system ATP-binding protein
MIVLNNINKKYKNVTALDDVSVLFPPNKVIGIIGPNGSGKSTLLKILTGLINNYQGKIEYQGIDKSDISLASEEFGFPSYYSAAQILEIFQLMKNGDDNQRRDIIDQLQLNEHLDKKVSKLSQGYKQRLNIACALLGNSSLVIFDEPNNGLDPSGFILLRKLILSLKAENKSIFIASHLLNEVESVCDKVLFIKEGQIVCFEDKTTLLETYETLENAYSQTIGM